MAYFYADPTPTQPLGTFTFTSRGDAFQGRTIAAYTWDFGDGSPITTKTTPTFDYRYRRSGTFHPTLTVTDSGGLVSAPYTTTKVVTVPVTLTGTVRTNDCTDTSCRTVPARGVKVSVRGPSTVTATTLANGSWRAEVSPGSYAVAPVGGGFVPNSRTVAATADVGNLDFSVCASIPGTKSSTNGVSARVLPPSACPTGLDWRMLERAPQVPGLASTTSNGMLRQKDVYGPLSVFLNLTIGPSKVTSCSPSSNWKWTVKKQPVRSKVSYPPRPGCESFMQVDTEGLYTLVAKRYSSGSSVPRQTITRVIDVRDLLVVAMGDSNGSGEGIPPFWFDQCNRGSASYQYQAAKLLEAQSKKHASVTYVSASCSGGRTQYLSTTGYAGVNPARVMPPQINALRTAIAPPAGKPRRTVDAAVVSIGVNNIAFGAILGFCIEYHGIKAISDLGRSTAEGPLPPDPFPWATCQQAPVSTTPDGKGGVAKFSLNPAASKTLASVIAQLLADLPKRYTELSRALAASGLVPASRVYLSQYPAFSYGNGSDVCDAGPVISSGFPMAASPLPRDVWVWFSGVARGLNNAVKAAAPAHGWKLIPVPEGLFYGHGYCASDRWFVAITTQLPALLTQGSPYNANGLFHPTERGAHVSAVMALKQMCPLLADPKSCVSYPAP